MGEDSDEIEVDIVFIPLFASTVNVSTRSVVLQERDYDFCGNIIHYEKYDAQARKGDRGGSDDKHV